MIIAWILSLFILLATQIIQLERLVALEVIGVNSYVESQRQFIAAENAITECELHLVNIAGIDHVNCHIQSLRKNHWLISSKTKPKLEVIVFLDEKTKTAHRLSWRQNFE